MVLTIVQRIGALRRSATLVLRRLVGRSPSFVRLLRIWLKSKVDYCLLIMLLAFAVFVTFMVATVLPAARPCRKLIPVPIAGEDMILESQTTKYGIRFTQRRGASSQPHHRENTALQSSVLFAVMSGTDERWKRNAIRDTWATRIGPKSRLVFVVGRPMWRNALYTLTSEILEMGDLIMLDDIHDHDDNLTMKTIGVFDYFNSRSKEDYLMKLDGNVYVKLDRLEKLISGLPKKKVYLGAINHFSSQNVPDRFGKEDWTRRVSTTDYPDPMFPPYHHGFAYLVSRDLTESVSRCRPKQISSCFDRNQKEKVECDFHVLCPFKPFRLEDVSVGGIIYSHLAGKRLVTSCNPEETAGKCRSAVSASYSPFVRSSREFIPKPWTLSSGEEDSTSSDDFIAVHMMNPQMMSQYFEGGEGQQVKLCSLAPSRNKSKA